MKSRSLFAVATIAGAVIALAGCTFSANLTVPAEGVATLAAKALTEQWDAEAEVDCGKENVDLVVDTEIDCVAHNPNSGLDYPATVTITEVDGGDYSIDVVTGAAASEDEPATDVPADAPTVTPESLADLASGALGTKLGYEPVVDCGVERIAIFVDAEIECVATGDDGQDYAANIIVTDVGADKYNIDVTMGAEPLS